MLTKETTDLNVIVDNIDDAAGRNTALQDYIFALRDLQILYDEACYEPVEDSEFDAAVSMVRERLQHLNVTQAALLNCWPEQAALLLHGPRPRPIRA